MKKKLEIKDLELMSQSRYVATIPICLKDKLFGDDKPHTLTFDVFDGMAHCANYKGKEYVMKYPTKDSIKLSKSMEKTIREHLKLDEKEDITELHLLKACQTLEVVK